MTISNINEFNSNVLKLPEDIRIDVVQRVYDGLCSGRPETDPYIIRQFQYVSECLNLLGLC